VTAINVTVIGNLAADPELKFSAAGRAVASFTVCSNERFKDAAGEWKDGPTSFVRCVAWAELAEHSAESIRKGDRVVVAGQLRQRDYTTKEGEKRTVWEVTATEIGAALKYATVKISKMQRDRVPPPEDPWSESAPPPEEAPF